MGYTKAPHWPCCWYRPLHNWQMEDYHVMCLVLSALWSLHTSPLDIEWGPVRLWHVPSVESVGWDQIPSPSWSLCCPRRCPEGYRHHHFALYTSLGHPMNFTGLLVYAVGKHFHALCLLWQSMTNLKLPFLLWVTRCGVLSCFLFSLPHSSVLC